MLSISARASYSLVPSGRTSQFSAASVPALNSFFPKCYQQPSLGTVPLCAKAGHTARASWIGPAHRKEQTTALAYAGCQAPQNELGALHAPESSAQKSPGLLPACLVGSVTQSTAFKALSTYIPLA